jgi:hypothetical protein
MSQANVPPANTGKPVRLTLYTPPEKDFAIRYLALRERKSLNLFLNEVLDQFFKDKKINPETLSGDLP